MAGLVTPVLALANMTDMAMMEHQLMLFARGLRIGVHDAVDERESLAFQLNAEEHLVENVRAAARVALIILARQAYAAEGGF
jgi:hypothetical protein